MIRTVRLLLACLLIAALPLQGIAAATMAFCGSTGTATPAAAAAQAHEHSADHAHELASEAESGALPDATHTCTVCMACCHAVALPPSAEFAALQPEPQGPIAAAATLLHERPSSVLERPPRA